MEIAECSCTKFASTAHALLWSVFLLRISVRSSTLILPFEGRSVPVVNNELAVAFVKLRRILDRNRVQKELRLTERHEKKGYKRRRLASQRWRRRFAHEVCSDRFFA